MSVDALVYYSVGRHGGKARPDVWRKLQMSAETLRRSNVDIPAHLFAFDDAVPDPTWATSRHGLAVHRRSYDQLLARLHPRAAPVLSLNPALHRFLVLDELRDADPGVTLYLDVDTLVLGDLSRLFATYDGFDCCAREEPGSRRHAAGYAPHAMIDEDALLALSEAEGLTPIPAFNCGTVLLSRRARQELAGHAALLVDYAWRLTVGMVLDPADPAKTGHAEGSGVRFFRQWGRHLLTREDVDRALPMPTKNRWLMDEVALWLTLGAIDGLKYHDLAPCDVVQDGELLEIDLDESGATVAHYFHQFTPCAERLLRRDVPPRAPAGTTDAQEDSVPAAQPVPEAILSSPLVVEDQGIAVYDGLCDDDQMRRLCGEAMSAFWNAELHHDVLDSRSNGRGGHPPQCRHWGTGGPVQQAFYHSGRLLTFLSMLCGVPVEPSGARGGYAYYTRPGDFVGLHLDVEECDVVVLTILHDTIGDEPDAGALVVYPGELGRGLAGVRARPREGAIAVKPKPGQSAIMFGGLVPHYVAPVEERQARVVSVLCFQAYAG